MIEKKIKNDLLYIITMIVDNPSEITIESEATDAGFSYKIYVDASDIGKIIGKEGRVAAALRTIIKASGAKSKNKISISIMNKPIQ